MAREGVRDLRLEGSSESIKPMRSDALNLPACVGWKTTLEGEVNGGTMILANAHACLLADIAILYNSPPTPSSLAMLESNPIQSNPIQSKTESPPKQTAALNSRPNHSRLQGVVLCTVVQPGRLRDCHRFQGPRSLITK